MTICPHCKSTLRIKLSAQYISQIDDSFYEIMDRTLQFMPKFFQGLFERAKEFQQPIPVYVLSCSQCDSFLDLIFGNRKGFSSNDLDD